MILATADDVANRLRRDLTDDEEDWVSAVLEEASALVEGYLGVTYTADDDIPSAVVLVVSGVAARSLLSPSTNVPEGLSLTAGPFSVTGVRDSLWLSKADKLKLRNLGGGFTSVTLKSERSWD